MTVVNNAIDGITLTGNVISLDAKVLGAGKVSVNGDYTLALDKSLTTTAIKDRWMVNGTNATYDNVQSFYYTPSADDKTFAYNKEVILKNLVTVRGLVKGATVTGSDNIAGVDGGSISISNKAVTLKGDDSFGNKVEVLLADGYTLKNQLTAPAVTKTYWVAKGGTAKLNQDRTEGYTLTENEKTGAKILTYSKANTATVATVTGLDKTLVDTDGAVDGITLTGNVISLDAKVLNNAKVSLARLKPTFGKSAAPRLFTKTSLSAISRKRTNAISTTPHKRLCKRSRP